MKGPGNRRPGGVPAPSAPITKGPRVIKTVGGKKKGCWPLIAVPVVALALLCGAAACGPKSDPAPETETPRPLQTARQAPTFQSP